jgi:hypothetical protein
MMPIQDILKHRKENEQMLDTLIRLVTHSCEGGADIGVKAGTE